MSDYNINVNITEGGKTPSRNPSNPVSTTNGSKLSKTQAASQLKESWSKRISTAKKDVDKALKPYAKAAGVAGAVITAAYKVGTAVVDYNMTSYSIRGADYKSTRTSHTMDQVKAGVGLAASAAAGAYTGAVIGSALLPGVGTGAGAAIGTAVAAAAYTANQAWNIAKNNRTYIKDIQVDRVNTQYYSNRLRNDISQRR